VTAYNIIRKRFGLEVGGGYVLPDPEQIIMVLCDFIDGLTFDYGEGVDRGSDLLEDFFDRREDEVEMKERVGPPTTGKSLDRFLEDQPNPSPVRKMLDLSTAHMPESSLDWGGVRVVEHEHGFIVFVDSSEEAEAMVPVWLMSIWKFAAAEGCFLINLDSDGQRYEQFKRFES
jgi:hypothetical protein